MSDVLPPAVAEFIALTPIQRALMVADGLVAELTRAGIDVGRVDVDAGERSVLSVYASDPAVTPALAVVLGLSDVHVAPDPTRPGRAFETFTGFRGGVDVRTHHTIPDPAVPRGFLVDAVTGERLSGPLSLDVAREIAQASTLGGRPTEVEAVA